MGKNTSGNEKKSVKARHNVYNLILIILIGVLFIAVYTNILRKCIMRVYLTTK